MVLWVGFAEEGTLSSLMSCCFLAEKGSYDITGLAVWVGLAEAGATHRENAA